MAVFLIVLILAFAYYFLIRPNFSPEAKAKREEKKRKQEEAEKKAEEERKHDLEVAQTVDLKAMAQKVDIVNLKPKEWVYYIDSKGAVTWYEHRTKTTKINYGGLTGNIKIMKGLHYRMGSLNTDVQKSDYLKPIFTGYPILTNRRLILYAEGKAKAYPFTRMLAMTAYSDGTVLTSNSGKEVILTGFSEPDVFNVYLKRLSSDEDVLPYK